MSTKFAGSRVTSHKECEVDKNIYKNELKSEGLFQHLLESLDEVVYRISLADGCYKYLSPTISVLTGFDSSRFLKESDFLNTLLIPDFLDYYNSNRCQSIKTSQPCELRYKINDSRGEEKWILQTVKPRTLESGQVIALEGAYRDITEQQKAVDELEILQHRLEKAQQIARLGNWEWNIEKDTLWWSEEIFRIFGLDSKIHEPSYEKFLNQAHEDDRAYIEESVAAALEKNGNYNIEHRIVRPDASITIVREIDEVRFDAEGNPVLMSGTVQDITEAKRTEVVLSKYRDKLEVMVDERAQRIEALNKDLIKASRRAGMAEVASGVLHNVGNVLNSINTSVALSTRNLNQMDSRGLVKACNLLQQNKGNIGHFLEETITGTRLLEYLSRLANFQINTCGDLKEEMYSLKKNVEHIKQIISAQQSYAHARGIKEKVHITDAIRQAIVITELKSDSSGIEIIRTDQYDEEVEIEVHKLLQILVNLLSNAKSAVLEDNLVTRKIIVSSTCSKNQIEIAVEDTGNGIEAFDMGSIYTMGYTTKEGGHGFGLHTSALLAAELGGRLDAYSEGKGKGARFVLTIER